MCYSSVAFLAAWLVIYGPLFESSALCCIVLTVLNLVDSVS